MRIFEPTAWEVQRSTRLLIGDGRVACPVRGEVDLEACFGCKAMVGIIAGGDPAYVTCRPAAKSPVSGRA